MSLKHIKTLSLNPFFMSKIIKCFLTGYEKNVDLKTLFYVLPIILYKPSRDRLANAKSNSSVYSLFGEDVLKRSSLAGFIDRYNELKSVTGEAIIILVNESKIQINNEVSLLHPLSYNVNNKCLQEYLRPAFYLGKVLSGVNIIEFKKYIGVA